MIPDRGEAFDELRFLHAFYKAELKREHGLWRPDLGAPDFEGIAAWYLDVYQNRRMQGWGREAARAEYVRQIRASDEWRNVFAVPTSNGQRRVLRVTNDGDAYAPRMYSYWSNAYAAPDGIVYVFAGSEQRGRAKFFAVDAGETWHAIVLDAAMSAYPGTTEGWSWDSSGWITFAHGSRIVRRNPFSGDETTVLDISQSHPGCRLWQSHSTDSGTTHCATIEQITSSGPYRRIGTIVKHHDAELVYPALDALDESQVTDRFLVIKEGNDNRVIDLDVGHEYVITNAEGAVGHSDCDGKWLVGEDDQRGACVRWNLETFERQPLFSTWNMGHVSLCNGRILHSDETNISVLDVGGNRQSTLPHGARVMGYDSQVRANWDPTGRLACYMVAGQVYLWVP